MLLLEKTRTRRRWNVVLVTMEYMLHYFLKKTEMMVVVSFWMNVQLLDSIVFCFSLICYIYIVHFGYLIYVLEDVCNICRYSQKSK